MDLLTDFQGDRLAPWSSVTTLPESAMSTMRTWPHVVEMTSPTTRFLYTELSTRKVTAAASPTLSTERILSVWTYATVVVVVAGLVVVVVAGFLVVVVHHVVVVL